MSLRPAHNAVLWQRLLDTCDRFRGDVALYLENRRYSRVRVDAIECEEARLTLTVTLLPTRGLYNERPPSWTTGGIRQGWTFSEDLLAWSCQHIGALTFEPGLIDAVVRWGEHVQDEPYNHAAVNHFLRAYRQSLLKPHLEGELGLFWRSRPIGRVTENALIKRRWFVGLYPWIRGTLTPVDLDPDLERDLVAYAEAFAQPAKSETSLPKRLYAGWGLKTTQRTLIRILVPIIDFESGSIQWRCESLKALPSRYDLLAQGLQPPRPDPWSVEEIQEKADAYAYGYITAEEFAAWFLKILHRLARGTDLRPVIALLPDTLPDALRAELIAFVDEQADEEYHRK